MEGRRAGGKWRRAGEGQAAESRRDPYTAPDPTLPAAEANRSTRDGRAMKVNLAGNVRAGSERWGDNARTVVDRSINWRKKPALSDHPAGERKDAHQGQQLPLGALDLGPAKAAGTPA